MKRTLAPPTLPFLLTALAAAAAVGACSGNDAPGAGGDGGASSGTSSSHSSGIATGTGGMGRPLPHDFHVSGRVLDADGKPVGGAIVMQGGGAIPTDTTGSDGKYDLALTKDIPGSPTAVAAKIGFRSGAVEFEFLPDGDVDITMIEAKGGDNILYAYGDPGTGKAEHDNTTEYCGHCHTTFVAQFQTSMHAQATKDPLVQDLYAGVTEAFTSQAGCEAGGGQWRTGQVPGQPTHARKKCYVGAGVLPDLNPGCGTATSGCDDPGISGSLTAFGGCADCHSPGIPGIAGGHDLLEATGIAFDDGNHCDFCHHVRDVDLSKPPGAGGALIVHRSSQHTVEGQIPPAPIVQVMYGPLPDVPNAFMGGSWQPKFKSAELCGGCHEQKQAALVPGTSLDAARWPDGLPTHSTYSEWMGSGFAGTACQQCHMPPDNTGLTNTVDVTEPDKAGITFGFVRSPADIRQHIFKHPLFGSPRFIDSAVSLTPSVTKTATDLVVSVRVLNVNAGHAMPTGEPMRALVLLLEGDACGAPLVPSGGMTVPDVGGFAAEGAVGSDVTVAGTTLNWAAGAGAAKVGDVVRVVRPTGTYDDYAGNGFFANAALTAQEKGLEIRTPAGWAKVTAVAGGALTLDRTIAAQAGDRVYLGDDLAAPPADGSASRALAGALGYSFARVMVDAGGARNVPHHRAVDIASDNRVPAEGQQITQHTFTLPTGCSSASVKTTLVYRPVPVNAARLRGWDAKDYVIASSTTSVPLP